MELFVPGNTSACLDINSTVGSLVNQHDLTQFNSKDLSMNDLKTCLDGYFNIEDIGTSSGGLNLSPVRNDIGNVMLKYEFKGSEKNTTGNSISEKCFSKCATFPPLHRPRSFGDVLIGEEGNHEKDFSAEDSEINGSSKTSRSLSLPVHLNLVSAMKGSREKQGTTPKKLSVTWAPDVYDPIPTSVSYVPSNKYQSYRPNSKKSGRYNQKGGGKSPRGNRGKDKKQVRKNGGESTKLKHFHDDSGVGYGEPQVRKIDFDVGSPDLWK